MPLDFSIQNLHEMRYPRLRYSVSSHVPEDVGLRHRLLQIYFRVVRLRWDHRIVCARSFCMSDDTH
ncbi:hypothetical protein AR158_c257L [Paramecium bursaria Chlorella virus AR158]|uniref:hypothetical protein n=1 Tax=Paramecium bursaria Chlorella virus AR158 TaxID=380598 RepID=UPI00015AA8B5|nr:hypothetical protein AR158_c257L [Paramecium bursaria Chlorella virus AR158]ABU43802.1 hypothetical protein AR158_c257L [Paramecium bursaria Chlorella virus AR158]